MFALQLNPHHSYQFGRDSVNSLGRVGMGPIFKPIRVQNPNEVKKEAVSSIQRLKR